MDAAECTSFLLWFDMHTHKTWKCFGLYNIIIYLKKKIVHTGKINGVQSIGLDENSKNILQNIIFCVLQKKKVES